MQGLMFMGTAGVAVFCAIMVITRKNPIASIMYLLLTFFSFASMYVILGAQFLAAIQLIVYGGAILVLFLFVVMLLNLREDEEAEKPAPVWRSLGFVLGIGLLMVVLAFIVRTPETAAHVESTRSLYAMGRIDHMGKALFTDFVLPFEIAGVLLLAAVLGAVALAKKNRA